jgi:hypothetical protein
VAAGLRPPRTWLAVGISAAVLALAVADGVRSSPAGLGPLIVVESVSARISGIFLSLGAKAPLGYAFVAGMIASVNPCGFVLLPAYLGYYLADDRDAGGGRGRTGCALAVSATMTASFALWFGLAGILAGLVRRRPARAGPAPASACQLGERGVAVAGRHLHRLLLAHRHQAVLEPATAADDMHLPPHNDAHGELVTTRS